MNDDDWVIVPYGMLSIKQKLVCCDWHDKTIKEIADELGVSDELVRVYLSRFKVAHKRERIGRKPSESCRTCAHLALRGGRRYCEFRGWIPQEKYHDVCERYANVQH